MSESSKSFDDEDWMKELGTVGGYLRRLGHLRDEYSPSGDFPDGEWELNDSRLGWAMKYFVAWRALESESLEEANIFSIAHLLEASNELEASLILAESAFYKQARQQLRSLIELSVMPLHFCANSKAFERWLSGAYRSPRLRGRGGLLKQLVADSFLSSSLADALSDLYSRLSGSIHNEERELAHSGIFNGNTPTAGFSLDALHDWAELFSNTIDGAIRLGLSTIDIWEHHRPRDPFCPNCHNTDRFDIVAERFGGDLYDKVTCQRCRQTIVRPLQLADPASEIPALVPGIKLRPATPAEMAEWE